ncbi:MAG: hypothetical protein ACRDLO_11865, partial [Solirubrobacterales bacterium]
MRGVADQAAGGADRNRTSSSLRVSRTESGRAEYRGWGRRAAPVASRPSMALTDPSDRLAAIPAYMFAELERKVAAKR